MRWHQYAVGFIPTAMTAHVLIVAVVVSLDGITDTPAVSAIAYHKGFILSILMVVSQYLVSFVHEILTLAQSTSQKSFYKFWYPLLEHVLSALFVFWVARMGIDFVQIALMIFVYNTVTVADEIVSFANYQQKYSKFLGVHEVWINQDSYRQKYKDGTAIATLLSNIVNEEQESIKSYSSDSTKVDDDHALANKLSSMSLPPKFNVDSEVSRTLPRTISKSTYDLVDRLYTVSPRNTYHLVSNAGKDESIREDPLADLEEDEENIDEVESPKKPKRSPAFDTEAHWGGGGGGNFKYKMPNGGKVEFGGGAGFDYGDDQNNELPPPKQTSESTFQNYGTIPSPPETHNYGRLISVINWFAWLLPPFLPLGKKRVGSGSFPLLRERLSTYNLERACSVTTLNYAPDSPNDYAAFRYFISYYFDYRKIDVDPMFERYGMLHTEMPFVLLLGDLINKFLWSSIVFLVYGACFMNHAMVYLAPWMLVLTLFRMNYLRGPPRKLVICELGVSVGVVVVGLLITTTEVAA